MTPDHIIRLRRALDLTQAELANRIGMHRNTVARMERGEIAITTRTAAALELLWLASE